MAFNGSGSWSYTYNWENDAANGIPITASRMDAQFNDVGNNGFDNCLTRDGQGIATANIPWGGFKITGLGAPTTAGDALSWGNDAAVGALTGTALVDISGASAGQVKFPASQNASANANTLDDYEEGTFSPIINFGGSQGAATYANNVGRYTKVGNRVMCSIYIRCTSKGSATGSLTIELLPFTSINVAGALLGGGLYLNGVNSNIVAPSWFITPNATNVSLRKLVAGTDSAINDTDCTDALEMALNFTYETAS